MSVVLPTNVLRRMSPEDRATLGRAGTLPEEGQRKINLRLERELQHGIAALLRQENIIFDWSRMDRKATKTRGWPDFTFAVHGAAVAFEAKLPGRKLAGDQETIITRMRENGWLVFVVRSIEDARDILAEIVSRKENE